MKELARLTLYGDTSISAQLRHLRKPRYGAFVIDKQVRKDAKRAAEHGAVWEYRLRVRSLHHWLTEAPSRKFLAWIVLQ